MAREDYSQMLGARAAAAPPGDSATRWKRGAKPPKPKLVQTKRPKRLLIDDLTMHLRPYVCDIYCTIIIMGDLQQKDLLRGVAQINETELCAG